MVCKAAILSSRRQLLKVCGACPHEYFHPASDTSTFPRGWDGEVVEDGREVIKDQMAGEAGKILAVFEKCKSRLSLSAFYAIQ